MQARQAPGSFEKPHAERAVGLGHHISQWDLAGQFAQEGQQGLLLFRHALPPRQNYCSGPLGPPKGNLGSTREDPQDHAKDRGDGENSRTELATELHLRNPTAPQDAIPGSPPCPSGPPQIFLQRLGLLQSFLHCQDPLWLHPTRPLLLVPTPKSNK